MYDVILQILRVDSLACVLFSTSGSSLPVMVDVGTLLKLQP